MDRFKVAFAALVIFLLLGCGLVFGTLYQLSQIEYKSIKGKVTHTEIIENKDYIKVTFDNGQKYNLAFDGFSTYTNIDDNATMIFSMCKSSTWLFPNSDNVWSVYKVIKVPEEK